MPSDPQTIRIGGAEVHRLGFGAMHLTGPRCWGPPADRAAAIGVARRAVDLGVTFIDTADSYGGGANEELLAEALAPYADDLLIGTKAGQSRPSPAEWVPLGRPEYLRQQAELSLMRLRVERLDLFQLHRIDPQVPAAEQFGALRQLQDEGKVRDIGLSEVTVSALEDARQHVDVVSVQNRYSLLARQHEPVLDYCEANGIAFIPWEPMASGRLVRPGGEVHTIARELDATTAQVSLAWLLRRSPVIVPIPGTSSEEHLAENLRAVDVTLSDEQFDRLSAAGLEA